jgi:uncharacterized protein GlcG (DUF336 family)
MTLLVAARMTEAALRRAHESGAAVSAAVVDAGGHLVHFQRMDGAEIAGPTLAVDKAFTAVAHRSETAALTELAAPGGQLAGLNANGAGRYVVFGGGVPCWFDGRVVGGVGVSGGTVDQDVACADTAAALFRSLTSDSPAG